MRTTDFSKETEEKKHSTKNIIFLIISVLYLIFLMYILIYWIWLQNQQIKPAYIQDRFSVLLVISMIIGMLILFAVSIFYNSDRSLMGRQSCGTQR